jgi:predicted DNA-binding transcriptional regulator AlpA
MSVTEAQARPAPAAIARESRRALGRAGAEDPLINITAVEGECGLSRATIDRRIKAGIFPPPANDEGWRLWRLSDLRAWKTAGAAWRSALAGTVEN